MRTMAETLHLQASRLHSIAVGFNMFWRCTYQLSCIDWRLGCVRLFFDLETDRISDKLALLYEKCERICHMHLSGSHLPVKAYKRDKV
jgi:hypothetical protein